MNHEIAKRGAGKMTVNNKVWILDDQGLTHDAEIKIYEENDIEWKWTEKKDYQADLINFGQYADVVVIQVGYPCDKAFIKQLQHCKAILAFGMGFNNVDLAVAREYGIDVSHVPEYCLDEVADHTLALLLSSARQINHYDKTVKQGHWSPVAPTSIHRMNQLTVGLYGFGRIARKVAARLNAFGVNIIASDAYVPVAVFNEYGVKQVSFETLLDNSHILSLHVPLNSETRNSLNYKQLKKLPKHARIINTCRGGIINEADLLLLLQEDHLAGAALDVLAEEPPTNANELITHERTIISPHAAYFSLEAEEELQTQTAENVLRVMNQETLNNIVN